MISNQEKSRRDFVNVLPSNVGRGTYDLFQLIAILVSFCRVVIPLFIYFFFGKVSAARIKVAMSHSIWKMDRF